MQPPAQPSPTSAAAPLKPPSVCIVVLNYNGRKLLGRFLPLIARTDYQPLEIVVVDNASSDDSCGWLRARWPQVTLLQQNRNLGYAGGNNVGIRYALEKGHRYVVIANNDIEPHPAWIREAVAHAAAHPTRGIIGFNLFNQDVARPVYQLACEQFKKTYSRRADQVPGCAMFCDTGVFRAIGFFDETYRFYAEEHDLELRAQRAGWQTVELSVPVWHLGEASTRKLGLRRAYLQMRNAVRMSLKLHGFWAGLQMVKTVMNRACNPWLRLDMEADYRLWRYRPSTPTVNGVLALGAIAWNLLALPQTLWARHETRRRIEACGRTAGHVRHSAS